MKSPLTFVLVHGAWPGGWCWRRVADLMRKDGHLVFTPTLTGFGERVHLTHPDLTLEDFATDIVNVIAAEELSDIILVGHSFGGNPVSVVADRVPELLKQLVYLDTLLLKNGESGFSQLDSAIVAQRIELAEKTSGGLTIPPPSPEVFGVVDPVDAEWLRRRLTPLPLNCYQVPIGWNILWEMVSARLTLLARTRFTSRPFEHMSGLRGKPIGNTWNWRPVMTPWSLAQTNWRRL